MALVTFDHLRRLKYCRSSIVAWGKEYGVDIRRFRAGVPSEEVRATGHPFAIRAADLAESEQHQQQAGE